MAYNSETGLWEGFIYKIYNDANSRIYIGQTRTTIKNRWKQHRVDSHGHRNTVLYRAMRKYGIDKFHVIEIDRCYAKTIDELVNKMNELEIYYIKKYQSLVDEKGYNIDKGGTTNNFTYTPVKQYDLMLNYIATFESMIEASESTGVGYGAIQSNCAHRQQTGGGFIWCYENEEPQLPTYTNKEYNLDNVDTSTYSKDELLKLMTYGWNGQKVVQYNPYGEVLNIFKDPFIASNELGIKTCDISDYLERRKIYFNGTILRYEDKPFTLSDLPEESKPISMYDMNGNFQQRFINKTEADIFLGVCDGAVSKAMSRGGSCKGHLFSYYGEPIIRKIRSKEIPIEMIDNEGNVIKSFDYIALINTYLGIADCYKQIRKAIKEQKLYKGYYWRYKEEFAIA